MYIRVEVKKLLFAFFYVSCYFINVHGQENEIVLSNNQIKIVWENQNGQWIIDSFSALKNKEMKPFGESVGKYSIIYSQTKPSQEPLIMIQNNDTLCFPEKTFKYVYPKFQRGISEVPLNRAGIVESFYPENALQKENRITFFSKTTYGDYTATWSLSDENTSDIQISIVFEAQIEGYYSLPSVSSVVINEDEIGWSGVPGFFMGNKIQPSLPLSYAYGHGLPEFPIICRESTVST